MWPVSVKSKEWAIHAWRSLLSAQSPGRPICASSFQNCWSPETLVYKKHRRSGSYLWHQHWVGTWDASELSCFSSAEPSHLLWLPIPCSSNQSPGQKVWEVCPRPLTSMIFFFGISVTNPKHHMAPSTASRAACRPRTVWRWAVLCPQEGPPGLYDLSDIHLLLFKNALSLANVFHPT